MSNGLPLLARCQSSIFACKRSRTASSSRFFGPRSRIIADNPAQNASGEIPVLGLTSAAMKSKGGSWSYDELFKFLKSPGSYIPGTKMSFAGLRSETDRINLVAYLRTDMDSPAPIPPPSPNKGVPAEVPKTGSTPAAAPAAGAGTQSTKQEPSGTSVVAPGNQPPPGNAPSTGANPFLSFTK